MTRQDYAGIPAYEFTGREVALLALAMFLAVVLAAEVLVGVVAFGR